MAVRECEVFIFCNEFSVFPGCCLFPLLANFNSHRNLQGPLMRCLQPLRQLRAHLIAQIGHSTRYITKLTFSVKLWAFLFSTDSSIHPQKHTLLAMLPCPLLDLKKESKAAKGSEKVIRMSDTWNGYCPVKNGGAFSQNTRNCKWRRRNMVERHKITNRVDTG